MKPIQIMLNGIPGNVALNLAQHALVDKRLKIMPYSLTGPEITVVEFNIDSHKFKLLKPNDRKRAVKEIIDNYGHFIAVDYTHPSAVVSNAKFYCELEIPFVMGTTGGDRKLLEDIVLSSNIAAVIAPNMAKQVVGFQAMMEYAANSFPDIFKGYSLEIKESHQKGKADTSGTAKSMIKHFNKLGVDFTEDQIIKIRDPQVQKEALHIPEEYLDGHGWHTYTLTSNDGTAQFSFSHNINGRDIYAQGTIDAILYLQKKIELGITGKVYSMIDVLTSK
ncbi:MAG: dihydrodipicolinate reductase [Desulfobacterales bacterium]|nr:dihydrodipicolinate reductase [Desulfobacterales bacterium]